MGNMVDTYDDSDVSIVPVDRKLPYDVSMNASDDIFLIRLLEEGMSINSRDEDGNTALHYAVLGDRLEVLKFLLRQKEIEIDAVNSQGCSALNLALREKRTRLAVHLIRAGADINLPDDMGYSPIHYVFKNEQHGICRFFLRQGPDVNAQNTKGETALHFACQFTNEPQKIYMLLYYGADAWATAENGIIPLHLLEKNTNLRDFADVKTILFKYTFDEHVDTIDVKVLVNAMMLDTELWCSITDAIRKVYYDEADLEYLKMCFPCLRVPHILLLFEKFEYVMRDFLLYNSCTLSQIINVNIKRPPCFVLFLQFLFESPLVYELVQSCCPCDSTIGTLVTVFHKNKFPLETLTEFTCIMLSYGMKLTSTDLDVVYALYGRCELFDIMLHIELENISSSEYCDSCTVLEREVSVKKIAARLIYDINLTIDEFVIKPRLTNDSTVLLDYFASPKLQELFLYDWFGKRDPRRRRQNMPTVPYLVELARNAARIHIIQTFKVRNAGHLNNIIKRLPIADEHKKILSYEKKLYPLN